MACNHPMKAFWTGNYTENNKKEYIIIQDPDTDMLSFSYVRKRGFEINLKNNPPYISKFGEVFLTDPITIPCGHCIACRLAKAKEWTTRVCIEALDYENSYFITLTYDEAHMPYDGQLSKRDLSLFIKRLRHKISFKYFACGEYGDEKISTIGIARPHYHLIILTNDELKLKSLAKPNSFISQEIAETWKFGFHEVCYADEGCISYTAGYVYKKQIRNKNDDQKVKPFVTCSDQPGFGFNYFLKHKQSILDTKKVYVHGKSNNVFKYIWRKLSEEIDIDPIKDELHILAGRSTDKLKWYFNQKYYGEFSDKLDKIYQDYLENKRKEKI